MFRNVIMSSLLLVFVVVSSVNYCYADLTIDPSGNVGIGTTSPVSTSKLTTQGSVSITSSDADWSTGGNRLAIDYALSGWGRIFTTAGGGAAIQGTQVQGAHFLSNGNVGIGTTSPGTKLNIKNNGEQLYFQQSNADNGWKITVDDADGYLGFLRRGEGGSPSDTEKVTITPSGNVGIGTTIPVAKLSVDGNITLPEGSGIYSDNGGGLTVSGRMIYRDKDTDIIHIGSPNYGNALYIDPYGNYSGAPVIINPVGGNVGIGTTSPSKRLYVNGSAGGTQNWNASDRRWKRDIQTIPNALKGIMKIRGVQYNWKDGSVDESTGFDDKTHYGVVAQEVEAVFPYLVDNPGESDEYKHVEYNALMGILIEAVKELKTENNVVKEENEQLRNALASLTDRQKTVESMLLAMSSNLPKEKLVMK